MKNNKKTWIIAFVSGFISATVAFSAFNYIYNKQKNVDKETKIESSAQEEESAKNESPAQTEGSVKMTFTKNDGSALENNSIPPVIVDGKTEASNLTVSDDGTTIKPFKIKLYELGDGATYSFDAYNTGDKTVNLDSVRISTSYLNSEIDISRPIGLRYELDISSDDGYIDLFSSNGDTIPKFTPTGEPGSNFISVPPGGHASFTIHVDAEPDAPFYATGKSTTGTELTLGQINLVWS